MIKSIQFTDFPHRQYPFSIPSLNNTKTLSFNQPITIFVGDNGSGKSTLLKAIAYYNESINVSSPDRSNDYQKAAQELSKAMKLSYTVKTRQGFFFSGEDFITYINHIKQLKRSLKQELAELNEEFKGKSDYVRGLATGPVKGELHALESAFDTTLNQQSHGEGFLSFFKARMHQQGLYLLDEPETPLSPINQYQLMVLLTDVAREGSQVIIVTHSPILMALENAVIYHFDETGIQPIQYDDIEAVQFTKHFLNDPDNYTKRI